MDVACGQLMSAEMRHLLPNETWQADQSELVPVDLFRNEGSHTPAQPSMTCPVKDLIFHLSGKTHIWEEDEDMAPFHDPLEY